MPKTVPHGPGLEPGGLPFSKVVEANGFVFLAGQIGDAPGSNGPVRGGIEATIPMSSNALSTSPTSTSSVR